jgi:hypothetical protein
MCVCVCVCVLCPPCLPLLPAAKPISNKALAAAKAQQAAMDAAEEAPTLSETAVAQVGAAHTQQCVRCLCMLGARGGGGEEHVRCVCGWGGEGGVAVCVSFLRGVVCGVTSTMALGLL